MFTGHLKSHSYEQIKKLECIPVGCVPPAHWPYLIVSDTQTPLPCTPPTMQAPTMHTPCHACPLPCMPPAMHAPPPCMPLPPCHTCPPATHAPLPHMPPCHTCPPAMHAPPPCMPPCHACPLPHTSPCHARLPPCGQKDTCKNITFANFVCGR